MQGFDVDVRLRRFARCPRPENIGRGLLELILPGADLAGVDAELLRQLRECPVALDRRDRHLRLEGRRMVPACTFRHHFS